MRSLKKYREFLKFSQWDEFIKIRTDADKGIPAPPIQKPYPKKAALIGLVPPDKIKLGEMSLLKAINQRESRRKYTKTPLTKEELSYLLWATQGIRKIVNLDVRDLSFRTVPSAGTTHPFETYILVNRVNRIEKGLYRYLPVEHKLILHSKARNLAAKINDACINKFIKGSAVIFIWTVIPYRAEWRSSIISHKAIALDAGHVCQNLYLAAESIGAGACAIAAYIQKDMDKILKIDGEEEFTMYIATVGKV